jgi:transcriptional regulator with XRE-family HTH domain
VPTMDLVKVNGEKLRTLRLERFMSREELARASGINRDHIGRLERSDWEGGSRPPTVRKLAEALGVDPRELLEDQP